MWYRRGTGTLVPHVVQKGHVIQKRTLVSHVVHLGHGDPIVQHDPSPTLKGHRDPSPTATCDTVLNWSNCYQLFCTLGKTEWFSIYGQLVGTCPGKLVGHVRHW